MPPNISLYDDNIVFIQCVMFALECEMVEISPLMTIVVLFQNEISEEEQRWGSKTVEGSTDRAGALRYGTTIQCRYMYM